VNRRLLMIEIILLQRVQKLGHIGDVVKVKPGYARNFLLPQKKALRATAQNRDLFEQKKSDLLAENLQYQQEALALAETMKGLSVIAVRQAGETGILYGSVSSRDVSELVSTAGFKISRQHVQIDTPIKTIGLHDVRIVLHPEVSLMVTVNVAKSEDEARVQAATSKAASAKTKETVVIEATEAEVTTEVEVSAS
jgi:large subunit ribosomal protein L9